MTIKEQLDRVIAQWNLLNHPFYRAWSAGTLPVEALRDYAREYGAFIAELPAGWRVQLDMETAHEEEEHIQLWAQFAEALGVTIGTAERPAVRQLVMTARELFSEPTTALGALYAFEAQQPATAQSKLEGLTRHYSLPEGMRPYFEVHATNHHEAEKILARLNRLSPEGQARALWACEQMCRTLWDALTDLTPTHLSACS
ncbi:MAG: iron-containing redox enzyme family protein [Armatimonadota bacterium]